MPGTEPLHCPNEASPEGAYHLRDAAGHRVGLAYTLGYARLWCVAALLLDACEDAEREIERLRSDAADQPVLAELRAAIRAAKGGA